MKSDSLFANHHLDNNHNFNLTKILHIIKKSNKLNSQEILETNKVIKLNKHLVNSQVILIDLLFYIGPTVLYLQLLIIFHSTYIFIANNIFTLHITFDQTFCLL